MVPSQEPRRDIALLWPQTLDARTAQHSGERNKDARADKARDEVAKPATEADAYQPQQKTGEGRAYDAENNVHENAGIALHEHLGQPTGQAANDYRCDPTNLGTIHRFTFSFSECRDARPCRSLT